LTAMTATRETEFVVQVEFNKRVDGRYHIRSPNLPGLHLAGPDFDQIRVDLEPVVRDLLHYNLGMIVETIRWVPSIDEITVNFKGGVTIQHPQPNLGKPSFLVIRGHKDEAA
jgi:hypothetical protein